MKKFMAIKLCIYTLIAFSLANVLSSNSAHAQVATCTAGTLSRETRALCFSQLDSCKEHARIINLMETDEFSVNSKCVLVESSGIPNAKKVCGKSPYLLRTLVKISGCLN